MALRDWQLWNSSATRRKGRCRAERTPARSVRLAWDVLESRLAPAVSTWSGAVSSLWSDSGNWDLPPVAGNDLVFPADAANLASTDDIAAATSFGSLTVAGSGYTIGGNAIALSGTVDSSQASGSNAVNLPITASGTGPLMVTVDQNGAELVLGGAITGSGGVTLTGSGVLDLTGANTYTGTTTVSSGVVDVNTAQPGSPVTLDAGATLSGSGTVGTITSTSATLSPGNPAPGRLTDSGDLNLDSGSTFRAALNGETAGSDYSQMTVSGQVNLGGATLDATAEITPTGNESFTILDNTGTSAVNGTFAGLPQGAMLTISGEPYSISYTGGDGNDVVLTSLVASTTSVTSSSSSVISGQPVTLTAIVAAADSSDSTTPTGTVEFFAGTTDLGPGTLDGGVATLTTSALAIGENTITAQYGGDINFAASTASATTVTVSQASTTTTLEPSVTSLVSGQAITLTATVAVISPSAGTPTGSVEFFSGTTDLGPGTLDNGVATLTTSALTTADTTLTATYGGDGNFTTSMSSAITVNVSQASTITSVTVVPNPSTVGATVTLTATVAATSPGSGTPTGSVEFISGSTDLGTVAISGGVATISISTLTQGSNSITAQYTGDSNFTTSTSPAVTATVNLAASTTSLSASPTSFAAGQTITLTATVTTAGSSSSVTPTGTVQFFNGTTLLGSVTLSDGVATLSSVSLTATSMLTAVYEGDANYTSSTSAALTAPMVLTSTTTVTTSPNPSLVGQSVTLAAAVATSDAQPTGDVMFLSNGIPLGTVMLDSSGSAVLMVTTLPAGSDAITAQYSGDSNYAAGTSAAVTQTVTQASSTTTLTVAPLVSSAGQSVTLSVNVAAASPGTVTPTGTVTFLSGSTTLGTSTLDANGNASLVTTTLPTGTNSITAQYSGDSNFTASTSAAVTPTVSQVTQASNITLSASTTNPSGFSSVQFTATVAPAGSTTTTPTGPVVFFANGAVIGSATLDANGNATFSTSNLALGSETIVAVYPGDSNYSGSTTTALSITVGTADQLYVNQIYLIVLDRPAEQGGLESWTTALQDGLNRQHLIRRIIASPEGQDVGEQVRAESSANDTSPPALTAQSSLPYKEQRINSLYETILGRLADPEGVQFFVNVVNNGSGAKLITIDLLGSDEYYSDITDALQSQSS